MRPVNVNERNERQINCREKMGELWMKVSTTARIIIWVSVYLYLLTWISEGIIYICSNIPYFVYARIQLWRILTAPVFHANLLWLILALLVFIPLAIQRENELGTIRYFFIFITTGILIQIFFVLICFLLSFLYENFKYNYSMGLWSVFFADLVVECNKDPDLSRTFFCLPIHIKSKYYPWFLIVIFTLISGLHLKLDLFVGIGIGYLFSSRLQRYILISARRATIFEEMKVFSVFKESATFVSVAKAAENLAASGEFLPQYDRNSPQTTAPIQPISQKMLHSDGGVPVGGSTEMQSDRSQSRLLNLQKQNDDDQESSEIEERKSSEEEKETNSSGELIREQKPAQKYAQLVEIDDSQDIEEQ